MKWIHISDLHIGKRVLEYSMIENQAYVLNEIVSYLVMHEIKILLISGDIYDTSIPIQEGVSLFNDFLNQLNKHEIKTLIISGNHDSNERLNYGSSIFNEQGIYIRTQLDQISEPIIIKDEDGEVNFYMLPFCKPHHVRTFFQESCFDYNEMMRILIDKMNVDFSKRNVLLAHQFVLGKEGIPEKSDSEIYSLGGIDEISYQWLEKFDYVALGHIHKPQKIQKESIRYSGSILKYSTSEKHHIKSMVEGCLQHKQFTYQLIKLLPKQDLIEVKGKLQEILISDAVNHQDFVQVTLTDEQKQPQALYQLKNKFPYLLQLSYETSPYQEEKTSEEKVVLDSPLAMFEQFYKLQTQKSLNQTQLDYLQTILQEEEVE
ncbi:MAG: exonuclease SbcCD subunit D [Erysipelotrichaceae bacterium]